HTTHRTQSLLADFAAAFGDADRVIVTPIYRPPGRESAGVEITASDLVDQMAHPDATAVNSLDAAYDLVVRDLAPGTMVIVFGAGSITTLAHRLAEAVAAGSVRDASRPVPVAVSRGAS